MTYDSQPPGETEQDNSGFRALEEYTSLRNRESPLDTWLDSIGALLRYEESIYTNLWDTRGIGLTRSQFTAVLPDLEDEWLAKEAQLLAAARGIAENAKPVGPELLIYRTNRLTPIVTPMQRMFGYRYLDPQNPAAELARAKYGADIVDRLIKHEHTDQTLDDPDHLYKMYAHGSLGKLISHVQERVFTLWSVINYKKNDIKIKRANGNEDDIEIYDIRPDEVEMVFAFGHMIHIAIEKTKRREMYTQDDLQPYLNIALRTYDPGIPAHELTDKRISMFLGQKNEQLAIQEKARADYRRSLGDVPFDWG